MSAPPGARMPTAPFRWDALFSRNGVIPSLAQEAHERSPRMAAASPPQVGVVVDKNALNAKLGALSQSTRKVSIGFQELIEFMAPYTAADLENLYGFTAEEASLFLSCVRGATEAPALVATVEAMEFIPRTGGV